MREQLTHSRSPIAHPNRRRNRRTLTFDGILGSAVLVALLLWR
jgi:hypothetical protein